MEGWCRRRPPEAEKSPRSQGLWARLAVIEPEHGHRLARGSGAEAVTDHQPQVVGGDLDQVALLNVPGAAQPGAAQAADVEDEGETALNLLGAQLEGLTGDRALEPRPVVVDRPPGRVVTLPAGEALLLLFRDAALPGAG